MAYICQTKILFEQDNPFFILLIIKNSLQHLSSQIRPRPPNGLHHSFLICSKVSEAVLSCVALQIFCPRPIRELESTHNAVSFSISHLQRAQQLQQHGKFICLLEGGWTWMRNPMKGSMVRKPVPFKVTSTSSPAANSFFDTWGIGCINNELIYDCHRLRF